MAALNLITFADSAGSRAGVLLSGGRVLDLAVAMPPARDMLAVIDGGAAMLAAIRAALDGQRTVGLQRRPVTGASGRPPLRSA